MNEIIVEDNIKIEDMIFEVRGKQVILDSDLAKLYECKNGTKSINLAVKRHINRFPERFMFQLTKEEFENLKLQKETSSVKNMTSRFQTETLNKNNQRQGLNLKYLPYAFTEQGAAMLSTVLKTPVAEEASIRIMDAFVAMKKYISNELLEQRYVNKLVYNLDERVSLLENTFSKFETFSNELFFDGQIYDAYSLLLDIFNRSNKSIVIIDNYISKELLDVVCKTNKKVSVYTKNIDNNLISKYQSQYNNLDINITDKFHDRFIIIDDSELYHCGASFKDLGKKCFAINKINSNDLLNELKNKL